MSKDNQFGVAGPSLSILEAMTGTITGPHPVVAQSGTPRDVYLVAQGAGLWGLKHLADNRQWSGLVNHILGEARLAGWLAHELVKVGVRDLDPQLVIDGVFADHLGKRQYVEACHYPHLVQDSEAKRADGADAVMIKSGLLQQRPGIRPELILLMHEIATDGDKAVDKVKSWPGRIIAYADLRFGQTVGTREARLAEMSSRGRISQTKAEALNQWSLATEKDIFARLPVSPDQITDEFPPQPAWEQALRNAYLEDVEAAAFGRIRQLQSEPDKLASEFPTEAEHWQGWWGRAMRSRYHQTGGQSRLTPPCGTDRSWTMVAQRQ